MRSRDEDAHLLEYEPRYIQYRLLNRRQIVDVLLVSSIYDSFIMEEDVRLSDQIYEEFHNLNLRTIPHISRASSASQALELLQERKFDLVITMRRVGDMDPWAFAEKVKGMHDIPVILLLNNSTEIPMLLQQRKAKSDAIDKVFVWNGYSNVFVAIIKLLEDRMNVDADTRQGDVRVIILVEDSIRFYSLYLPVLYSEIMRQTHRLIREGGNDYFSLLQMRSRPKILLASTYEEATAYYGKYKDYILGVITDMKFPRGGELQEAAGFDLVRAIREEAPTMPVMIQSSDEANRSQAEALQSYFANKSNPSLDHELRSFMLEFMGFGSFTFRLPSDEIVAVANNLFELRAAVERIPLDSVVFHARNDHFSGWLSARGEFEMARELKPRKVSEFADANDLRLLLMNSIDRILQERLGIIVDFDRLGYQPHSRFVRLRPGSLGGKGRGIAFLLYLRSLFGAGFNKEFPEISIKIPKTFVIGTDEFEIFMQANHLYDLVFSGASDEVIIQRFAAARLSDSLRSDLEFIFKHIEDPLAVRSSHVFEDTLSHPFAGVFATYMIPNCDPDTGERVNQLALAIKLVYASSYLDLARAYASSIGVSLAGTRMAVIIQEVVGSKHGNRYYPTYSGTAASYNYYPLGDRLRPEDRIAHLALGLGKTVAEGGPSVRFSPRRPEINLYSSPEQRIKESQREFFAITLENNRYIDLEQGDNTHIRPHDLRTAITDGTLAEIADTYNHNGRTFASGFWDPRAGYPVVTFNRQLKYGTFPLAQIINRVLMLGEQAMGYPVEVEFAGEISRDPNSRSTFYLLQLRPFIEFEEGLAEDVEVPRSELFVFSSQVSGNRAIGDIRDIVTIKPGAFENTRTLSMVDEVDGLNAKMVAQKRPYILIGPGRWGTHDHHLGIPVSWKAISGARVILEVDLENFIVDHSQGSHFFHNITTAGIPYLCVRGRSDGDYIDWNWLESLASVEETAHFRHVRTESPMHVIVNGKKRQGRIVKG